MPPEGVVFLCFTAPFALRRRRRRQPTSFIRAHVQVRQRLFPELEPRAHRQDDRVSAAVLLAGHTWGRRLLPRHLGGGGRCALDALPRATIQLCVAGTYEQVATTGDGLQ